MTLEIGWAGKAPVSGISVKSQKSARGSLKHEDDCRRESSWAHGEASFHHPEPYGL